MASNSGNPIVLFEALGELISGKVFDGPEEAPKTTTKSATEELAEEVTTHDDPKPKRRKPAPSVEHIFERDDAKPRKQRKADGGSDAVAAEEASAEGEAKE